MLQDFEFRLRARTDTQSPQAIVLRYLNSKNTLYPAKDMAMIALVSYWLPLAVQAAGNLDLEPQIRSCLYRLQLHQQYLQGLLGEIPTAENLPPPAKIPEQSSTVTPNSTAEVQPLQENLNNQSQPDWFNPFQASAK